MELLNIKTLGNYMDLDYVLFKGSARNERSYSNGFADQHNFDRRYLWKQ